MLLNKSSKIANGGILSALSLLFLYAASVIPTGKLALLAASSFAVGVCISGIGVKFSMISYAAVSLLGFIMIPQKLYGIAFVLFLGIYPFIKLFCETRKIRAVEWILKFVFANISFAAVYFAAKLFVIPEGVPIFAYILLFNAVFLIYDIVFSFFITKIIKLRREKL